MEVETGGDGNGRWGDGDGGGICYLGIKVIYTSLLQSAWFGFL